MFTKETKKESKNLVERCLREILGKRQIEKTNQSKGLWKQTRSRLVRASRTVKPATRCVAAWKLVWAWFLWWCLESLEKDKAMGMGEMLPALDTEHQEKKHSFLELERMVPSANLHTCRSVCLLCSDILHKVSFALGAWLSWCWRFGIEGIEG